MPRDTAGNYTLPAGNPVASGEIISASWANSTMNDLGQSLSASLDRYGRGGMLAPFQFTDGTESAPGATWSNEPTTGLYRAAYGDLRFTLTGTDVQRWTSANAYLWRNSQWEEILTQAGGGGDTTINNLVVTGSFTSPGIDDNATSTAITIDSNENVGIGTDDPLAKLSVLGTNGDQLFLDNSGERFTQMTLQNNGVTKSSYSYDAQNASANIYSSDSLIMLTGGDSANARVIVDPVGNVGIGDIPKNNLDVVGATGIYQRHSSGGRIVFDDVDTADASKPMSFINNVSGTLSFGNADRNPSTGLTTNSSTSMTIDALGNVGINAQIPSEKLHVGGNALIGGEVESSASGTTAGFRWGQDTASHYWKWAEFNNGTASLQNNSTASTASAIAVDLAGSVGIGTTSPDTYGRFVVQGSGSPNSGRIVLDGFGTSAYTCKIGPNDDGVGYYSNNNSRGHVFYTGTAGTERLRIAASGDVTIATDGQGTTTSRSLKWGGDGFQRADITVTNVSTYAADMHFSTGNNTNYNKRMTIDSLGRVGIGTETPTADLEVSRAGAAKIDVEDTGGAAVRLSTAGSLGFVGTTTNHNMLFLNNDTESMRLDTSGRLLVGADSSTAGIAASIATKVQVIGAANGTAGIGMRHTGAPAGKFMRMWASSVNTLYVQNNGNTGVVLTDGATAWTTTSDESLKENISDIGPVLDTIKDFRCVNYSLKTTESEAADKVGFIAQDWEHTFPNVVSKDEEGTLSMKYTETIPVLLKATQEQQAMIETLQAEVAALKGA